MGLLAQLAPQLLQLLIFPEQLLTHCEQWVILRRPCWLTTMRWGQRKDQSLNTAQGGCEYGASHSQKGSDDCHHVHSSPFWRQLQRPQQPLVCESSRSAVQCGAGEEHLRCADTSATPPAPPPRCGFCEETREDSIRDSFARKSVSSPLLPPTQSAAVSACGHLDSGARLVPPARCPSFRLEGAPPPAPAPRFIVMTRPSVRGSVCEGQEERTAPGKHLRTSAAHCWGFG